MKTNKYLFILDNGHGGVINGVPQTAGKRSPDFGKGVIYEGVSNRRLLKKLAERLEKEYIYFINLVPELEDVSLKERVRRVNAIASNQKSILISIHSDAFTIEHANGWSAFTTKGETNSDKVSFLLYKYAKEEGFKLREDYSDGDPDKEEDFYIIKKTICPAVLVENLFMTNREDYDTLLSEKGQDRLVNVIFKTIKHIYNNGL